MNVKLLKQVRDYIARNPAKYDQSEWCGSACCVAGTTAFVSGAVTRKQLADKSNAMIVGIVHSSASRALGIDPHQAGRLFGATWSDVADGQFEIMHDMNPRERARVAVKRINHFIKTKGAE